MQAQQGTSSIAKGTGRRAGASVAPRWHQALSSRPEVATFARARKSTVSSTPSTNGANLEEDAKHALMRNVAQSLAAKYGKGTLISTTEKAIENIPRFSTGCLTLDAALGGGWPRGRIVEIYGPESCGKTTLALHAIAEMQKQGGTCVIVDVEQALDLQHATRLGVNTKSGNLWVAQPSCGEEALDIVDSAAVEGSADLIVVDSVSALVPRAELEGEIGATVVGNQARLMSQGLRKLVGTANKSNCTIIFINQLRQKVGVFYGNPETTSGGQALKYYSSVRIDLRKKEAIKVGDQDAKGIRVRAKVIKNKVAPPMREANFDILFDRGIDTMGGIMEAAELLGCIKRRGAWYYYGELRLGQGREAATEAIRTDEALYKELEEVVRLRLHNDPTVLAAEDEGESLGDDIEPVDELVGLETDN